jgi:hypothetical protein
MMIGSIHENTECKAVILLNSAVGSIEDVIFETANVDESMNRASKAARLSNLGPRHSIWEPDDSEDMDLCGSFIEKRFRSNSVAGSDWYRGQLISPIRGGGNNWMVTI